MTTGAPGPPTAEDGHALAHELAGLLALGRELAELGRRSEFARVLISEVDGDRLTAVAAWERDGDGDGDGDGDERLARLAGR